MISIDTVKYALKNSIMILVWLTIFFGTTSVNLTETEQLIVSTENPHAIFSVPNTEEGMMVWCSLSSNGLLGPLKQSRIQRASGLCMASITRQETVLST